MFTYIVIGSSRGLGLALVEELLKNKSCYVIGVARTELKEITRRNILIASGRYRHVRLDISSEDSSKVLTSLSSDLLKEPICVIFNAAFIKTDVENNLRINYRNFEEINRVGIIGLGNVLKAFEGHLLAYGGIFVGISSFSALRPPVLCSKIAYPASKAYLEMVLRSLRLLWGKKVKVITLRLGHLRGSENERQDVLTASIYEKVAKKLLQALSGKRIPDEVNYPFWYSLIYKYLFALFSDSIYSKTIKSFLCSVKKKS